MVDPGFLRLVEGKTKELFILSESVNESERDQRTMKKDQKISGKHQRKFLLSLSLGVNRR